MVLKRQVWLVPLVAWLLFCSTATAAEPATTLDWRAGYGDAMQEARASSRMMLIYFHGPAATAAQQRFAAFERDAAVRRLLQRYVRVKVPLETEVSVGGKPLRLIEHGAFAEMRGIEGLAIIDFQDPKRDHYGHVVSVLPFSTPSEVQREALIVLLDLPPGTLTQRTLIFAVRTHPERPASALGQVDPELFRESEIHSRHQAQIHRQGHHNWNFRFHRINRRLPFGMLAQEVCAESWPGQGLLEAARECVRSWRQSSGHWQAVRARQNRFGYDMKRGRNGIWYATGIFARRR